MVDTSEQGRTYPDLRIADGDGDARLGAPKIASSADGVLVVTAGIHEVTLVGLVVNESAPAMHAGISVGAVIAVLLGRSSESNRGRQSRYRESELHSGERGKMRGSVY